MTKKLVFENEECLVNIVNTKEHIQKYWQLGCFYELGMLQYIYSNYKMGLTYIDAGACIGNHTLFFAKIMEAKKVYSFEPIGYIFDDMQANIELNNLMNVRAFKNALGNKQETISMKLSNPSTNIGMSKKCDNETSYKVASFDLDFFEIPEVDILKIDIEGLNIPVLEGAKKILEINKPDIFIECVEDFKEVSEFLAMFGYKYTGNKFNRTPTYLFSVK